MVSFYCNAMLFTGGEYLLVYAHECHFPCIRIQSAVVKSSMITKRILTAGRSVLYSMAHQGHSYDQNNGASRAGQVPLNNS